jgi:hypothetical protein
MGEGFNTASWNLLASAREEIGLKLADANIVQTM